jgi:hypothetical protein
VALGILTSGFLTSGFLTSGFLTSGFLTSGFLTSGFLTSGFLTLGFLTLGFLAFGFLPFRLLRLGPLIRFRRWRIAAGTDDVSGKSCRLLAACRIVLAQKQRKRQAVAAVREPTCALMTRRAIVREQLGG